ncbi:MAG: YlxR family protein [Nodosilinea sp.]
MQTNQRRCVSCRRVAPKAEFWRVVRVYPDRQVCLDQGMGRSAYLCPQANCLRHAQKKSRLGRALKANVPDAIYQSLWQRLAETGEQEPTALTPVPPKT